MSTTRCRLYWFPLVIAAVWGLSVRPHEVSAAPIEIAEVKHDGDVDFEREILPILRKNCLACHNSTDAESDLILETPQTILKGGSEGPAAVPGKSAESLLLILAAQQKEPVMPPADNKTGAKKLTPQELGLIKLWIDQGAKGEVTGLSGPISWQPLPPGVNPIYAVAITADGQYAAAGRANQIFIYHVPSKREVGRLTDPNLLQSGVYSKPGVAELDLVQSLAFNPDGDVLASGGYRTVKLWRRGRNVRKSELTGLDSPPKSLAISSDGKWAAIGQENGQIKVFDLAAGNVARTLEGHTGAVKGLAFTTDSSKLVSGSVDKSYRVWSVTDGASLATVETAAAVNAVAVVNGDKAIATGGEDNVIRLWNAPGEGEAPPEGEAPKPIKEITGHTGPITSLATVPNAPTQLLSGSKDGTIRQSDALAGNNIRQVNHGAPVESIAIRGDAQRLVSVSSNNTARLWNATNGQQIAEMKGDFRSRLNVEKQTRATALAKRMADLAKSDLDEGNKRKTAEEDNAKKAAEALTKAEAEFKTKDEAAKKPLADKEAADKILADAKVALTKAEEDQKKATDDLANAAEEEAKKAATEAKQKADQAVNTAKSDVQKAEAEVNKLAAPAQKALDEKTAAERAMQAAMRSVERAQQSVQKATEAIPVLQETLKNYEDAHKAQEQVAQAAQASIAQTEKPLFAVAFSPDGSTIAAAGESGVIFTWNGEDGAPVDTFEGQDGVIAALAFDAANDVVAIAANNTAIAWDVNPQWHLERVIGSVDSTEALVDRTTALAFSYDGKLLATGSGEPSRSGQLKIWNPQNGELVREVPEAHSDTIFALEFSRDGKYIASCAADRFMKVHDVETGKLVRAFEGHTHHVLGVSWSADGRTLASSGADKVVKVWDFRSGDQKRTITGFGKEVTAIRFVGDTVNFVASCGDKNVHMKNADNGGNVRAFGGSADFVYSVGVTGDAKQVVAGGQDSVFRIWNEAGTLLVAFDPPKEEQTASTAP